MHDTREGWLRSGTNELSPIFAQNGFTLPEKIRYAIAFTSTGKRGHVPGECWHPDSSADGYYEIIIRADIDDPVQVLCILTHELCHCLLPADVRHGKAFKEVATKIGFVGKMRQATPSALLRERLNAIAANLGRLPHAKLDFASASDVPRKQVARMLKAECRVCGYTVRLSSKWAKVGLPICPANSTHGQLVCDLPDEVEVEEDADETSTPASLADEVSWVSA